MRKIVMWKPSSSGSVSDPDILQSFPFIANAAWYQEYWYECEPSRIHKLAALLIRLALQQNKPRREAVVMPGTKSGLDASDASAAMQGSMST
jgi:hypothetical protein